MTVTYDYGGREPHNQHRNQNKEKPKPKPLLLLLLWCELWCCSLLLGDCICIYRMLPTAKKVGSVRAKRGILHKKAALLQAPSLPASSRVLHGAHMLEGNNPSWLPTLGSQRDI